jgi:predicted restriction endonuclease
MSATVCGETIPLADGLRYAEAHHIQPFGAPHNGPDISENVICLCPNPATGWILSALVGLLVSLGGSIYDLRVKDVVALKKDR